MNLQRLHGPALFLASGSLAAHGTMAPQQTTIPLGSHRPFIAIWCDRQGGFSSATPSLRIALWEDGRVFFAADPKTWNSTLQQGRVSKERVEALKKRIVETGVFDLKGTCYLVPDAAVDCLMVNFGTRRQMLYWDEVEAPHYGINSDSSPSHLTFKEVWKAVNRLVLASRPSHAKSIRGRLGRVPPSWYLNQPMQSK